MIEQTMDDVIQIETGSHHLSLFRNTFLRSTAIWGPYGTGPATAAEIDTRYFYKNVLDLDFAQAFCRPSQGGTSNSCDDLRYTWIGTRFAQFGSNSRTTDTRGRFAKRSFYESHGGNDYRSGWKIYNNTVYAGRGMVTGQGGPFGSNAPVFAWSGEESSFLNNIVVQSDDTSVYTGIWSSGYGMLLNGNVYFTPNRRSTTPLYRSVNGSLSFPSITSLRNALGLTPGNGWESQSVEADPVLNSGHCPSSTGAAASGGIILDPSRYPGAPSRAYRGAIDPIGCGF